MILIQDAEDREGDLRREGGIRVAQAELDRLGVDSRDGGELTTVIAARGGQRKHAVGIHQFGFHCFGIDGAAEESAKILKSASAAGAVGAGGIP